MVGSLYLTNPNVDYLATFPGQAHFAIDGQHTCRECVHWANRRGERTKTGNLKPARCRMALRWLKEALPIPHTASACRHFEADAESPEI